MSWSVISITFLAYLIESVKNFIETKGQKLSTSKFTKDDTLLSGILLNHLMISEVFLHWLTLVAETIVLLILSSIDLLILLISNLNGLISLNQNVYLIFHREFLLQN